MLAGPRLFPHSRADRALRVEERAERTARQDAVLEALAALPEGSELEGSTPGHLLGLVARDEFVPLVHLRCPPVADPLEETAKRSVEGAVGAEQEPDPVAAGLAL